MCATPAHHSGWTALTSDRSAVVRSVALGAVVLEVAFVIADIGLSYARPGWPAPVRQLFNIAREDGLASWFASTQTLLVSLTLGAIWLLVRQRGWAAAAAFFLFMAVDDGAEIHERLGSLLGGDLDGFPSYAWQLLIMPFFAAAGVALFVFVWRRASRPSDRALLVAGMACLASAIGLDFIEGLERGRTIFGSLSDDGLEAVRHFSKSLEEFLEMLGTTLLWLVFLGRLLEETAARER